MKVKEIEVWVDKENIESKDDEIMIWHKASLNQSEYLLKAKLIIEMPEKKIEITKSDLQRALHLTPFNGRWLDFEDALKTRLFGA